MGIKIAIAGNPNCGKTTLFNALTGSNQFVGNWPGVTVEKKEGKLKWRDDVTVTDLPGIYSLSPYTLEEVVARNYLIDERPDVIFNIVDGTNLERNLYLTTQLMEIGIPLVIAVNMMDVIRRRGDKIDVDALSAALGCPVVEISALKLTGIEEGIEVAIKTAAEPSRATHRSFSGCVEHALAHVEEAAIHNLDGDMQRWYAIKIFERDPEVIKKLGISKETVSHIEKDIAAAERELDDDAESIITNERYNHVTNLLKGIYKRKSSSSLTISHKIDSIVTNRWLALPIFAAVMFLVYFISVTTVGAWATDFMNDGLFGEGFNLFGAFVPGIPVLIERGLEAINCASWLTSLVVDGIIGGVGAVLGFVPQILVLFLILGFLEACGYMSRIAFVLDRIFRKFGLSGKSFIPLLIGTGCSVPGIMASRTIENERDRRMTVITTSFVPCGAKLPVIAFIAGALFDGGWWVAPVAYLIGVCAVVISGVMLKKTKAFAGEDAPFVMELPAYHLPTFGNLMRGMWDRGWAFIKKAGTIIMLSTVFIWLGSSFGYVSGYVFAPGELALEDTVLGGIGIALGWIFVPLGFSGIETTVATMMGLIAKEEIVAVLGVLDYIGMSKLAGYSFLLFNLLCAPCFAAMSAIRREMNNGKWTLFAIGYQTAFAYLTSFCVYQLGMFFTGHGGAYSFGAALSFVIIGFALYFMLRPARQPENKK